MKSCESEAEENSLGRLAGEGESPVCGMRMRSRI